MLEQNEHIENTKITNEATGNLFVHTLTLIWLVGVIFFDKGVAYISVGPIYITEFLLASMILCNLRKLKSYDFVLGFILIFYLIGGVVKGYSFFYAIRDLAWLYYLYFLRFFPRDFPKKYIKFVLYACALRVFLTLFTPVLSQDLVRLFMQKYRDAAVVLFLIGYLSMKSKTGTINIALVLFLVVVSYLSNYKTLIILVFLTPFLLPMRNYVTKFHSPKTLLALALIIVVMVYTQLSAQIMSMGVSTLNGGLSATGVGHVYGTGTSVWRAQIWHHALMKLSTLSDILFGEFPGHNFVSSKFLGIKSFLLQGGDRTGALRSAHNIVIQILMKTGLFGLIVFGWYYFKTFKPSHPTFGIIRVFALILALTADILEVPSRGPLLFCLFVILEIIYERTIHEREFAETVIAKSSLNHPMDNRGFGDVSATTMNIIMEDH